MVLLGRGGFPPDIRVEKECAALSAAGHDVFVLAFSTGKDDLPLELRRDIGCTIVRIAKRPRRFGGTNALYQALLPSHRLTRMVRDFAQSFDLDVLHAHDLHAVVPSLRAARETHVGRRFGVVADLHENMPAAVRAYRHGKSLLARSGSQLLSSYRWMRFREASLLRRCRRILVVVPEAAERFASYGIDPDVVRIVSNTEDESTFECGSDSGGVPEGLPQGAWVASYVGGIGPHRGIDTSLRALAIALLDRPDIHLLIVGVQQAKDRIELEALAAQLGVSNSVTIVQWVAAEDVSGYLRASKICLVPHNDFEHTQTTVPHKLFQYMLCGKPVLVSDCRPLARIIAATGAGSIFAASDASSMAQCLIEMRDDPQGLLRMGESGKRAARGNYSWAHDQTRLVGLYSVETLHAAGKPGDGGNLPTKGQI